MTTVVSDIPAAWFERALAHYRNQQVEAAADCCDRVLELAPRHASALNLSGVIAFQQRNLPRAVERFAAAARAAPGSAVVHVHLANAQLDLGDATAALASYDTAIALDPAHVEAHYGRGNALYDLGRLDEAVASFDAAIRRRAEFVAAHDNRALTLYRLRDFPAAAAGFERALQLAPGAANLHYHLGMTLAELNRIDEALASFEKALQLRPDYDEALSGRGNALAALKRPDEALASYARAIESNPTLVAAHLNRGNLLAELGREEEALASYQRALECDPASADVYNNLGDLLLRKMRRPQAAIAATNRAIALNPALAEAFYNRGNALQQINDFEAAVASYDRAIAVRTDYGEAFLQRGHALRAAANFESAIGSYARALALNPGLKFLPGMLRHTRMQICEWQGFAEDVARIVASVERGQAVCTPLCLQALIDDPPLHHAAARMWVEVEQLRALPGRLGSLPRFTRAERIRVGYFSADFRSHPVPRLIVEMLEEHDRSAFEISAFSFGGDSGDPLRGRIERAVEHFLDVTGRSDREVALLARELNLDIAVDLNGYTENCRPGIFALRAAPLQIGYIGFLGTSGAPYMDYLIADGVLIPPEERVHYSEEILYLPHYQANDSQRQIAERPACRTEANLPERGFVFCCFNANYKITPPTFDSWMRILAAVPGSVLFLCADNPVAERNLRREAASRAIDSARLIFGARLPYPEYLARYRLADLFLDTWPYNAGATASDALWSGLPVLTRRGRSMQARMAASLLTVAGLPELITERGDEYEQRAIELARDPARLAGLRARLAACGSTRALFDTRRFTRHLEQTYRRVYAERQSP